ncbi:hypothetical protein [Burkholderia sp. BCC0419]|uniref:hypothetical protein n=1 Tax=Burkholderia sp. BCC0419 TaxID=486878 RepID=UPI00158DB28F|nr:hypothetical protein [Burkholderia sp. BCC0419]
MKLGIDGCGPADEAELLLVAKAHSPRQLLERMKIILHPRPNRDDREPSVDNLASSLLPRRRVVEPSVNHDKLTGFFLDLIESSAHEFLHKIKG